MSIYNVVTSKIRSRSPKTDHFFPPSWWCICASLVKFHPFVKEIMCTQTFYCINKAHFLSIYSVVTFKIRSRSSKSNHFFAHPYDASVLVWSNPSHWLKRYCAHKLFTSLTRLLWAPFLSINNVVTLKIRSRSPKSNHFFPPSWWCICASLVKFHPLVEEIMCTQSFYCINKVHFFEYL